MNMYMRPERRQQLAKYAKKHKMSMAAVVDKALDDLFAMVEVIDDRGSPLSEEQPQE